VKLLAAADQATKPLVLAVIVATGKAFRATRAPRQMPPAKRKTVHAA
jgi:hypothetical protein